MNAVFTVGGVAVVLILPPLATAQTPSSQNIYVLKATARQTTITGSLTLTLREPFIEGEKRKVRETVITVPPTDVMESLTTQVRAHAGSAFSYRRSNELLFVPLTGCPVASRSWPENLITPGTTVSRPDVVGLT